MQVHIPSIFLWNIATFFFQSQGHFCSILSSRIFGETNATRNIIMISSTTLACLLVSSRSRVDLRELRFREEIPLIFYEITLEQGFNGGFSEISLFLSSDYHYMGYQRMAKTHAKVIVKSGGLFWVALCYNGMVPSGGSTVFPEIFSRAFDYAHLHKFTVNFYKELCRALSW